MVKPIRGRAKLGRNDPCWYASGKKYKRCHLGRERAQPFLAHEASKVTIRRLKQGFCLHPNASPSTCTPSIINAHSIQKHGGLNCIAHKGHVYSFFTGYGKPKQRLFDPKLIGIQEASTFRGFCQHHDHETFAPIERCAFEANPYHVFLVGYRALCHTLYMKRVGVDLLSSYFPEHIDGGLPRAEQEVRQRYLADMKRALLSGWQTLAHYKNLYDAALQARDFSQVSYYVIFLTKTPEFLGSSALLPMCDFSGRVIQDGTPGKGLYDHITSSLITTESGGAVVLSWLGKSGAAKQLIRSLNVLSDSDLPHAIVRFTFEQVENLFVSPPWWDSLSEEAQQLLGWRQVPADGVMREGRRAQCLLDDGLRVINWTIASRRTNCAL
jgi:hypothetical protein